MKTLESYNAGEYINMGDYKSFIPSKINDDWSWNDSELNKLVSDANLQLGKLDGYAQQIPNVDLYITTPCFYISNYIEENKNAYYDFLSRARINNEMTSWIKFFLEATIETAKTARAKFQNILQFTKEVDQILPTLAVKYENAKKVIDLLYDYPKLNRSEIIKKTQITPSTVDNILKELKRVNLINETTGFKRNQVYEFTKYIDLF